VMDNFNRRNADARIRTFRERVRNMTSPVTEGK
jgi:ribosomal protein L6P/L9E